MDCGVEGQAGQVSGSSQADTAWPGLALHSVLPAQRMIPLSDLSAVLGPCLGSPAGRGQRQQSGADANSCGAHAV